MEQYYYQILINDVWCKDFIDYDDAFDYAEYYGRGAKVEIKKITI